MSIMLRTALIVISLLTLWYTARKIRKAQLQIEDSIFWMAFPAACFPRYCYLGSQNAGSAVAGKFYFSGRYFYFDRKNIFAFFADFSVGYENSNVNTGNCHSGKAAAGEKGKRHSSIGIKAKGG